MTKVNAKKSAKMIVAGLMAAVSVSSISVPQIASAQAYRDYGRTEYQSCNDRRRQNTTNGAVLGAIAGAVIGRRMASRHVNQEGAWVGAAVGAGVGAAAGRNSTRCYNEPRDDNYGRPYEVDRDGRYDDGRYNNGGYRREPECGWGEVVTRTPSGREQHDRAYMCRDNNGNWYPTGQ